MVEPDEGDHSQDPPAPPDHLDDDTYTLNVGFPVDTPEDEAKTKAVADWHEACTSDGFVSAGGDPCAVVVRDNPNRTAMGEYMVAVAGKRAAT